MNHRVAVRTNRTQICNGVYDVFLPNLSERFEVVDVNEGAADSAIDVLKIEVAD
jgi:hypothetical protein